MSSRYGLMNGLVEVVAGDRKSLLTALENLGSRDCDFCGENGVDYLNNEVWKANGFEDYEEWEEKCRPEVKYESNMEYIVDKIKDIEDDADVINEFFDFWMGNDGYYDEYEFDYLKNNKGQVFAISYAAMTYC